MPRATIAAFPSVYCRKRRFLLTILNATFANKKPHGGNPVVRFVKFVLITASTRGSSTSLVVYIIRLIREIRVIRGFKILRSPIAVVVLPLPVSAALSKSATVAVAPVAVR